MKRNKIFIMVCFVIFVIANFTLIRSPKSVSSLENRTLAQFPHFTALDFIKGDFQNNFTSAMADQFIFSQSIKSHLGKYTNVIDYKNLNKSICKNRYVKVSNNYAIFNCTDRLVTYPSKYDEKAIDKVKSRVKKIQKNINKDTEIYYYFVYSSSMFDFIKNKKVYNMGQYFNKNYRELSFKNFEEFSNYFYKTDHHWNYKGQYKGYTDIIKMILGNEEKLLKPIKTINFKSNFYGSLSRETNIHEFRENFTAYQFNFPEHDEYINRKPGKYGKYEEYWKGNIPTWDFTSHYSLYYGNDQGEVLYDYKDLDKENLLVIGNSHKNSIVPLIATHFNKTYVVDLRFYSDQLNEKFSYKEYIKKNKIDKVLFIGDFTLYSYLDLGVD